MYVDITLTVIFYCRANNIYDGVEMHSSIQITAIHENSTEKDEAKLSDTTMSDPVSYDTINSQQQEQNTFIHESPSVNDKEAANTGLTNPVYDIQPRVI